jgi:hypothetical protein
MVQVLPEKWLLVLISAAKSRDFNALLKQGHEMQGEERS